MSAVAAASSAPAAAAAEPVALDVNDQSLEKYKVAADVANNALKALIKSAVAGKTTTELVLLGNTIVQTLVGGVFAKDKKLKKGLAFPVSIAVNDCVGNNSPVKTDAGQVLKTGDVVKIDLAVHIDFYVAQVAHTVVVGGGEPSEVVLAAFQGAQIALKQLQVGNTNTSVTEVLKQVADCYGVKPVVGVLMHQMKHGVIDGNNVIALSDESHEVQTVDEFKFEAGRVYTIDVIYSTGLGKPIQRDARCTIFKRDLTKKYQLKMSSSRALLSEVEDKLTNCFPFGINQLANEGQARLGMKECVEHGLFHQFPVLFEKPGQVVAQFKLTVLISPSGVVSSFTGLPLETGADKTDKLTEALKEQFNRPLETKKSKKKAAPAAAAAESTAE